jgi:peptidoglycan glycosyltransferase
MVSTPSYDPNLISGHDTAEVRKNYNRSLAESRPMLNRTLRETYPPGSTFKIGDRRGRPREREVHAGHEGEQRRRARPAGDDSTLPNENRAACTSGEATLTVALMNSCNVAFGAIGIDLGDEALREQARKFGFDSAYEVPMRSVQSHFPDNLNAPQTAQAAIGQFDVRATPLQMAIVAAAIANRGVVMDPYLVQQVRGRSWRCSTPTSRAPSARPSARRPRRS